MSRSSLPLTRPVVAVAWVVVAATPPALPQESTAPPEIAAKVRAFLAARAAMFRNAVRLGLRVGFGTDSFVSAHEINAGSSP
jgi:hypothetical protein